MPLAYGLIDPVTLTIPELPDDLQGLRLVHLTDLHINKPRRRLDALLSELTAVRFDLLVFTGDAMDLPGDEDHACRFLHALTQRVKPPLGCYGVFGNHDSEDFIDRAAGLPMHWLHNTVHRLPDLPLDLMGTSMSDRRTPDLAALALNLGAYRQSHDDADRRMSLLLMHTPGLMHAAADLNLDLVLSGHTHGGQIRLPGRIVLRNSSHLPVGLSAGVMHLGHTRVAISRGLGETWLPIRVLCPPHAPLYTLRAGTSTREKTTYQVRKVQAW